MFPASTFHHVEPQTINKERITLAFNIIRGQVSLIEQHLVSVDGNTKA